jgi:putative oxidoreductase
MKPSNEPPTEIPPSLPQPPLDAPPVFTDPRAHEIIPDTIRTPSPYRAHWTQPLGRVMFAVPFIIFGVMHFINAQPMAKMVPVPGGVFWIYFTGAALLAAGTGILTTILEKWACIGLAVLLMLFVFTIHVPALRHAVDDHAQHMALISILKDTALAGGALGFAVRPFGTKSM